MEVLTGKTSINGLFSMAMLNNQRVYIYIVICVPLEIFNIDLFLKYHIYMCVYAVYITFTRTYIRHMQYV